MCTLRQVYLVASRVVLRSIQLVMYDLTFFSALSLKLTHKECLPITQVLCLQVICLLNSVFGIDTKCGQENVFVVC
jgi:hypothetical protein